MLMRQPLRLRMPHREIFARGRSARQRGFCPVPGDLPEDGVHEAGQAVPATAARLLDRSVHGRVVGDPIEPDYLVGAEAQNLPELSLSRRHWLAGKTVEDPVYSLAPAQRSQDELPGEATVAGIECARTALEKALERRPFRFEFGQAAQCPVAGWIYGGGAYCPMESRGYQSSAAMCGGA